MPMPFCYVVCEFHGYFFIPTIPTVGAGEVMQAAPTVQEIVREVCNNNNKTKLPFLRKSHSTGN